MLPITHLPLWPPRPLESQNTECDHCIYCHTRHSCFLTLFQIPYRILLSLEQCVQVSLEQTLPYGSVEGDAWISQEVLCRETSLMFSLGKRVGAIHVMRKVTTSPPDSACSLQENRILTVNSNLSKPLGNKIMI